MQNYKYVTSHHIGYFFISSVSVITITKYVLEYSQMSLDIKKIVDSFCSGYRVLTYKKGDTLIRGDDEPSGVYFVLDGIVKMAVSDIEGSELAINLFKPGTFFPMTWAMADIGNSYFYQAFTKVRVVRVPKEEFLGFINSNEEVLYDLTKRILVGLDAVVSNMRHMIGSSSDKKVAVVLSMFANRFGTKVDGEGVQIDLPVTHQDIAQFSGLARETVTLALLRLKENGLVKLNKRKITITDLEVFKKVV